MIEDDIEFPNKEQEFKLFMSLEKNKVSLQKSVACHLLENKEKKVTVSGAFEDPEEVRSNYLPPDQITPIDHEEADTRIVKAIIDSPKKYQIVDAKDTDVLIAIVTNIHHMGNKVIYMRRAKNDVLDIPKIAEGLRRKGLDLRGIAMLYCLTGSKFRLALRNIFCCRDGSKNDLKRSTSTKTSNVSTSSSKNGN